MRRVLLPNLAFLLVALLAPTAATQSFQLIVTETPAGSGSGQPIQRYAVAGSGGAMVRLTDIPATMTNDPSSVAFRTPTELLVGNRAAHLGNSSVSRFTFDPTFATFVQGTEITGNAAVDVHQIALNPVDGELFVTNFRTGTLSRFRFDGQGTAVANGTISMPDTLPQLGVAIRAVDQQLFVSSYTTVRRFTRNPNGSYAYAGSFPAGNNLIHFMKFRRDELYVCDISTNAVYRFTFDASGQPVANGTVATIDPVDVAFSPDLFEMFVASHITGGITRFSYDPVLDDWVFVSTISGPSLGGIATTIQYFEAYGQGCAGTAGAVPALHGSGIASPGNTIRIDVSNGRAGAFGVVYLATRRANTPVAGCRLLIDNAVGDLGLVALDSAGGHSTSATIPPTLGAGDLYLQFFCLDAGAANGAFSASNGMRVSIF